MRSANSRSSRAPIEWNVPDQVSRAARGRGDDALDAPFHLGRGAARERHQQKPARIDAVDDEVGHPMGERVGLARPGAGDDQERTVVRRADAVLDGAPLLRIELGEIGGHRLGRIT